MPRSLKPEELEELEMWLQQHDIAAITHRTRRDYSDVVPVALLIKKLNAKLVDMYNYPARNSLALKLVNWDTFNNKVLCKMGLSQSKATQERLAQGVTGAVEALLFDIMMWQRSQDAKKYPRSQATDETKSRSASQGDQLAYDRAALLDINKRRNKNGKTLTQAIVDFNVFQQLKVECKEKEQIIATIEQKANYLESCIKAKDERINELIEQLGKLSLSILSKFANLDGEDEVMWQPNDGGDVNRTIEYIKPRGEQGNEKKNKNI